MKHRKAAASASAGNARQRKPQVTQSSVVLCCHPADSDRARSLGTLLAEAGVWVEPGAQPAAAADAVVVFLSATGLAEPGWLAWMTAATAEAVRLIPIRVGHIDDRAVPVRLSELNWIDWQPGNVRATSGYVLAGLLSDPGRRDQSRQLSHEAEAWLRSGRSDALLITDYPRARRMAGMLHDLERDRLAAPTSAMREFVQRSVRVSRPRHRRRRNRVIYGLVGAFAALVTVAVALPAITLGSYNNKESVVTSGDPQELRDLPEWSAANAAALLVNGTPAERDLARLTLLQAMSAPWEVDALQWQQTVRSSALFDRGQRAILAVSTGLDVIDVATQRVLWTVAVPGSPYDLSVDPAGRTALGLSMTGPGAIVVDLGQRSIRHVALKTTFLDRTLEDSSFGVLGRGGIALVRLAGQHLGEVSTSTGTVTDLGAYPAVFNLAAQTAAGPAAALVKDAAGRVDLIAVPSRTVIASMPDTAGADETGAIAPDGRHAVVVGGDGQLWTIGAGQPATPTGIPVPRILSGVTWDAGDRVITESEDQRAQVYYLPRAEFLGTVCWQDTRLVTLVTEQDSDVVGCDGAGGTTFWRLPPGPLPRRTPGEQGAASWKSGPVTVASSGSQVSIRGSYGTAAFQPFAGDVTAVDVASHGTRVIAGDSIGEVAVFDVASGGAALVASWAAPDASPVAAVGWSGGPVATTASGQTWRVSDCADCATDAGLLRALQAREAGCFTARQLAFIAASTWHELGLRECAAQPPTPSLLGNR